MTRVVQSQKRQGHPPRNGSNLQKQPTALLAHVGHRAAGRSRIVSSCRSWCHLEVFAHAPRTLIALAPGTAGVIVVSMSFGGPCEPPVIVARASHIHVPTYDSVAGAAYRQVIVGNTFIAAARRGEVAVQGAIVLFR
jgi:hypothetical protein